MVPPRERGRYAGYIGATFALATVSGPLIGGVIVDAPGWAGAGASSSASRSPLLAFVVLQKTLHLPVVQRPGHTSTTSAPPCSSPASRCCWCGCRWPATSSTGRRPPASAWSPPACSCWPRRCTSRRGSPSSRSSRCGCSATAPSSLATVASVLIGVAMFGSTVYLSQYFQLARGMSPTEAGLMSIAMVGGLLVSSIVSGRLITRPGGGSGTWSAAWCWSSSACRLLGTHRRRPPTWSCVGVFMAVLGLGLGATMQNLVLAGAEQRGAVRHGRGQLGGRVLPVDGRLDRRLRARRGARPPGRRRGRRRPASRSASPRPARAAAPSPTCARCRRRCGRSSSTPSARRPATSSWWPCRSRCSRCCCVLLHRGGPAAHHGPPRRRARPRGSSAQDAVRAGRDRHERRRPSSRTEHAAAARAGGRRADPPGPPGDRRARPGGAPGPAAGVVPDARLPRRGTAPQRGLGGGRGVRHRQGRDQPPGPAPRRPRPASTGRPTPTTAARRCVSRERRRRAPARPRCTATRRRRLDERLGDWSDADLDAFVGALGRYNAALDKPEGADAGASDAARPRCPAAACRRRPGRWRAAPRRPAAATGSVPQLSTTVSRPAAEREHVGAALEQLDVVAEPASRARGGRPAPRGRTPASSPGRSRLGLDGERRPVGGLRDPRLALARPEAVRRPVAAPRDRHPAAVAARARRCGTRPGPAGPRARRRPPRGRAPRPGRGTPSRAARASSASRRGRGPGRARRRRTGSRAGRRRGCSAPRSAARRPARSPRGVPVMTSAKAVADQSASSQAKLKAWCSSSGRTKRAIDSGGLGPRLGDGHPVAVVLVEDLGASGGRRRAPRAGPTSARRRWRRSTMRAGVGRLGRRRRRWSRRLSSLNRPWATSTRKPSTPRSSQNRSTSSNMSATSGLRQSRSGWVVSKRWRYHWSVRRPGSTPGRRRPTPSCWAARAVRAASVAEQVAGALGAARAGGQRRLEPRVLARRCGWAPGRRSP